MSVALYNAWLTPSLAPARSWLSPTVLAAHGGVPLQQDSDFFHPPPREIGRVLSAETSLRRSETGRTLFGLLPKFLGSGYSCSYVGEAGIARFSLKLPRENQRGGQVLRFAEVTDLRASWEERFAAGRYTDSAVNLAWLDTAGTPTFGFFGSFMGANPAASAQWRFADAAEDAWTQFLLRGAGREAMRGTGHLDFRLLSGGQVRIGRGYLEYMSPVPRLCDRCEAPDAITITMEGTAFILAHRDKTRFGDTGIFKVDYNDVINSKLFWLALGRLFIPKAPSGALRSKTPGRPPQRHMSCGWGQNPREE
jgi:hypothetical protein